VDIAVERTLSKRDSDGDLGEMVLGDDRRIGEQGAYPCCLAIASERERGIVPWDPSHGWEMKAAPIDTQVASFLNDSRSCVGLRMIETPTFEYHQKSSEGSFRFAPRRTLNTGDQLFPTMSIILPESNPTTTEREREMCAVHNCLKRGTFRGCWGFPEKRNMTPRVYQQRRGSRGCCAFVRPMK
jgi:hypothetical protein